MKRNSNTSGFWIIVIIVGLYIFHTCTASVTPPLVLERDVAVEKGKTQFIFSTPSPLPTSTVPPLIFETSTNTPFPLPTATNISLPTENNSQDCPVGGCTSYPTCETVIKGNISYNTGEKIYHVPGGQYYNATVINPASGERWFCSEDEANSAGWRRSKR